MSLIRRIWAVGVILVAVPWTDTAGSAGDVTNEPSRFVQSLGDRAISVLTNEGYSAGDRKARYRNLLDEGFAVNTIGRFALGSYWRAATPDERDEYLGLFREFVLDTYAERLAGETFEFVKAQVLDERDTMVSTEIRGTDGPAIRVDYRVRAIDGVHKIVDVLVEGVSLIVTQRAEFASVINREGLDGLIARLRQYESGAATD